MIAVRQFCGVLLISLKLRQVRPQHRQTAPNIAQALTPKPEWHGLILSQKGPLIPAPCEMDRQDIPLSPEGQQHYALENQIIEPQSPEATSEPVKANHNPKP